MKLDKIKLKWKLFFFILLFTLAVVFVFCFFQIFMLEAFYRQTKTDTVSSLIDNVDTLVEHQDINEINEFSDLSESLLELSSENEAAFYIFSLTGESVCKIGEGTYFQMFRDADTFNEIIQKAVSTRLPKFFIAFGSLEPAPIGKFPAITQKVINSADKSIICATFITLADDVEYLLVVDSRLTPVQPAIQTLKQQLFYISLIVIVLAVIVALVISRIISKPIMKMNASAKLLANGRRDIVFEGKGFEEITQLNQTLNYAVKELNKTDTLQKELLANISHDLKTPLASIYGYAEMMKDFPNEVTSENLQLIMDEASRLNILVNDLVNLSRLQAKTEIFTKTKYNFTQSLESIVSRQQMFFKEKGYEFKLSYNEEVYLTADEIKISQVIYNFIINAVNYSKNNKLIEIKQTTENDIVKVEVIDHGIGIKKDELACIWNRYYRVDKGHKRTSSGSGLGLAICKEILDYHHFNYGVESIENEGSVFWFSFKKEL